MTLPVIDYRKHRAGRQSLVEYWRLVRLTIGTAVFNAVRIGHKMVLALGPVRPLEMDRLVVVGFGGIGNHILLLPALSAIKNAHPHVLLHLAAASQICADLMAEDPNVDECSVLDPGWLRSFRLCLKAGRMLAAIHPSAVLVAAGADPVRGSVMTMLSHASIRVGEDWRGRAMFYTHAAPVDPNLSELRRNIRLAGLVGGGEGPGRPCLMLKDEEKNSARRLMHDLTGGKTAKILGVHAGSSSEQSWKRWGLDRFIATVRIVLDRTDMAAVFFLGPDETDLKQSIESARLARTSVFPCLNGIRVAAALIGCCDLFLSNDSGLRHLASAQGLPTITVFGPTSEIKNATDNASDAIIVEDVVQCRPCHYTRWFLACGNSMPCLTRVSPERVAEAVVKTLSDQ
ncbi:MAG: glycosyltransferase family 9 protein [Thermodesulfobacteriota bacterium]